MRRTNSLNSTSTSNSTRQSKRHQDNRSAAVLDAIDRTLPAPCGRPFGVLRRIFNHWLTATLDPESSSHKPSALLRHRHRPGCNSLTMSMIGSMLAMFPGFVLGGVLQHPSPLHTSQTISRRSAGLDTRLFTLTSIIRYYATDS